MKELEGLEKEDFKDDEPEKVANGSHLFVMGFR